MNIKKSITFSLESRKKNGVPVTQNVPIRLRVVFSCQRIELTTGYRIDLAKWDSEKQRVRNGCVNKKKQSAAKINAGLLNQYTVLENIFKEFEVNNILPTVEQIKYEFNYIIKGKSDTIIAAPDLLQSSFFEIFDEFVAENRIQNNWSDSTCKKFGVVKNHITSFDPNINFNSWTEKCFNKYIDFLLNERDMRNVSINKHIKLVKWFLRWSYRNNYHNNTTYENFKAKLKSAPKKIIFLTWNELARLRECVIPEEKQYLERVRDVFLFCCFTGLRYSDVYNMKRSDIKGDHIEVVTIKTFDNLIIELNKHSKTILDKYKDVQFKNDKALPVVSNQKMNDFLKELGELAEINEPVRQVIFKGNKRLDIIQPKYELLSTHTGRRTFICNAIALEIPPNVIMKWTGHNDYKAMKPYIDIADDIKRNAMDKFNQL